MLTKFGKVLVSHFAPPVTNSYQCVPGVDTSYLNRAINEVKSYMGNTFYVVPCTTTSSVSFSGSAVTETTGSCVVVGSGDTPATEDDYCLESQLTGLTATNSNSVQYDAENFRFIQRVEYTISNNGSTDVTIKEIGRVCSCNTAATKGATTTSSAKCFLVDRTVLEAPVVVPAGESSIVRYEFVFPEGISLSEE